MEFGHHSSVTLDQHSSFIFPAIDIHIHTHQPLDKRSRKVHVYGRITITLLHITSAAGAKAQPKRGEVGYENLPFLDMTEPTVRWPRPSGAEILSPQTTTHLVFFAVSDDALCQETNPPGMIWHIPFNLLCTAWQVSGKNVIWIQCGYFQWQNGDLVEPGLAWEVDVVIPGFQAKDVGTQLEWIYSCKAFGNNSGSRAEGWSKYLPDAPPARWFGDGCYPVVL